MQQIAFSAHFGDVCPIIYRVYLAALLIIYAKAFVSCLFRAPPFGRPFCPQTVNCIQTANRKRK